MRRTIIAVSALAASVCAAARAAAATLTLDGGSYVYTAAPGEQNYLHLRGDDANRGEVLISDEYAAIDMSGTDCRRETWDDEHDARCAPRGGIRVVLGDGGEGRDQVDGGDGTDRVLGGGGDDELNPGDFATTAADVVDGGPGRDTINGAWTQKDRGDNDPITVTLNGAADDGHASEGDNVIGVEHVKVTRPGTFAAGADAMTIDVWNIGSGSTTVTGSPGADDIR